MARRSGLGRGLGALIPTEVVDDRTVAARSRSRSAPSDPTPTSPATHFDEEALAGLAASVPELGVLQPVLVRPLGEDALRADRRRAPVAGRQAGRAADHPGASSATRRRLASRRAGPGREPAPPGPQPARGGGRLPAAHRGLRAHPRRAVDPGRQEPGGDHQHPAAVPAAARRSSAWWPTASSPPATPGPCSARPTGPSRRPWPGGRSPSSCRSAPSRRRSGPATSSAALRPRSRPRARARAGCGRPASWSSKELLSDHLDTRVKVDIGLEAGQGGHRVRRPRGPRADLPGHDRTSSAIRTRRTRFERVHVPIVTRPVSPEVRGTDAWRDCAACTSSTACALKVWTARSWRALYTPPT